MNMKDMIQRMTDLENGAKQQLNEDCGTMPAMPPANPGSPVSMNISLNASGKEHVEDLINMMKNAGMSGAQEVMPTMMPMRMDMERLRDVVDGPRMPGEGADNRPREEYMDAEELMAGGDDLHAEKNPADIRVKDPSGYENANESFSEAELRRLSGLPEASVQEANMDFSDKTEELSMWLDKYDGYRGDNGDALPMGWIKSMTSTGVMPDGWEAKEWNAYQDKLGKDITTMDDAEIDAFLGDPKNSPITSKMFNDLLKITGASTADEDLARAVSSAIGIGESIEEGVPGSIDAETVEAIMKLKEVYMDKGMEPEEAQDEAAEAFGVDPEELADYLDSQYDEGYDNEPDEQYDDHETMIHDLSGGINRQKKMYKKAADGDSDMAVESIKDQLYAMLSEKKAKPDFLDIDDTKEPMKKAIKDKKKGAVGKKKTNESYEMGDNDAQDMQYFNAIAALYGPDIWDNDAMADLAQDLADANPSAQDLAYIINKKSLPKHLANIKFSSGDQVQFGESSISEEIDPADIEELLKKLKAGEIDYKQFQMELKDLEDLWHDDGEPEEFDDDDFDARAAQADPKDVEIRLPSWPPKKR